MAELPAINTSPLIFLTKGGFLDLLQVISSSVIVPNAVATEIQAYVAYITQILNIPLTHQNPLQLRLRTLYFCHFQHRL